MRNKILTNLLTVFAVMMALCVCSCAKSSEDDDSKEEETKYSEKTIQKLLDKYDEGEMTEKDWSIALDQLEAAYDVIFAEFSKALKDSDSLEEFYDKTNDIVEERCELPNKLYDMLDESEFEMGNKNYERFEKIRDKQRKQLLKYDEKAHKKFGYSNPTTDSDSCVPVPEVCVEATEDCAAECADTVAVK